MGKRYVDEANTIELLCTKPGDGLPAIAGALLTIKDAGRSRRATDQRHTATRRR